MTFTKDDLASAFHELGELAVRAGKVIDLAVYGGSCLMLVSNFRIASEDVDAVAITDQDFIDGAAAVIAARRAWPENWLNDGVRTYLSPAIEGHKAHELYATYPDEATPGLRVYVPTPEYMLAMKLMAMRVEAIENKDLDDIFSLLQVVGIKDKSAIVAFAAQFYPEARVSGKLQLALDHLWREYQANLAKHGHEPPRYLGRSGPPDQS